MSELIPCKLCQSSNQTIDCEKVGADGYTYGHMSCSIECDCGVAIHDCESEEYAVTKWNSLHEV